MKWDPKPEMHFQFERIGYFVIDKDSCATDNKYVLNLTVTLKDVNKPKSSNDSAITNPNKSRKDEQDKQLAAKMVTLNLIMFIQHSLL